MDKKKFKLHEIPALLLGAPSNNVYLYIHGQGGNKEEAEAFANIACQQACQVLSIDLPEHGERTGDVDTFNPWHVIPELTSVMDYAREHWNHISLYANSIGAWFSMLSFNDKQIDKSLFVSPILDMEQLISNMMSWANVSEKQLEQELTISTTFGQTLSWEYLQYVRENPILHWSTPTEILYGDKDHLTEVSVVKKFTQATNSNVTVMKEGRHWFHNTEELNFLMNWINNCLNNK